MGVRGLHQKSPSPKGLRRYLAALGDFPLPLVGPTLMIWRRLKESRHRQAERTPDSAKGFRRHLGWLSDFPIFIVILLGMRYLMHHSPAFQHAFEGNVGKWQVMLTDLGILAPFLFIIVYALIMASYIPAMIIAPIIYIGLGSLIFGRMLGAFYSVLGLTIGCCLAFLLARYLKTNLAPKLKGRKKRFDGIDGWLKRHRLASMFSLRLIFFSNPLLNYASSMTNITVKDYTLGTLFGLAPRTFLFAHFFELLIGEHSLYDIMLNPYILLLPASRILVVFLLVALTRDSGEDIVV